MKITIEIDGMSVAVSMPANRLRDALREMLKNGPSLLGIIDGITACESKPATEFTPSAPFTADSVLDAYERGKNAGHGLGFSQGWDAATTEAATLRRMGAPKSKKAKKGGRR